MPISVDQLRNFEGEHALRLGSDGGLEDVNRRQRFKSFFNIGHAREENRRTLDAIRTAIQNDPRYFAGAVRERAMALLAQVRTDRAIGVAQIRTIVQELDSLSTPEKQRAAISIAVTAHIAANTPASVEGFVGKYTLVARQVVTGSAQDGRFDMIDVAGELASYQEKIDAAVARIGDDEAVKELFFGSLERNTLGLFDRPLGQDAINDKVDRYKAGVQAFDSFDAHDLGMTFLKMTGKPVHPGTVAAMESFSGKLPVDAISGLAAESAETDIHEAIRSFAKAVNGTKFEFPEGVPPFEGSEEETAAQEYVIARALGRMSPLARTNLLDALKSPAGENLGRFYMSQVGQGAIGDYQTFMLVRSTLERLSGSEATAIPDEEPDMSRLPPAVANQYSVAGGVSGAASAPLKSLITSWQMKAFAANPDHAFNPNESFKKKVNANATAQQAVNLAMEFSKIIVTDKDTGAKSLDYSKDKTAFFKDINRGVTIKLPDGKIISKDNMDSARDMLAEFVTGTDGAKFETAAPDVKAKVYILMASMNQSVPGGSTIAYSETLDPKGGQPMVLGMGTTRPNSHRYELSKDGQGNITIKGTMIKNMVGISLMNQPGMKTLGEGSFERADTTIRFPAADFERLAGADWTKYDHQPVDGADRKRDDAFRHETAASLVPMEFRFTGTVEADLQYYMA